MRSPLVKGGQGRCASDLQSEAVASAIVTISSLGALAFAALAVWAGWWWLLTGALGLVLLVLQHVFVRAVVRSLDTAPCRCRRGS